MSRRRDGFTLVELLVVTAVIAVLAALMAPAARLALDRSQEAYCVNQQRQLALGNAGYALDHGAFVPAAADLFTANLRRWHGRRVSTGQPFRGEDGPLAPYLGRSEAIRTCPRFVPGGATGGFEAACGGYGYNAVGIGSRAYLLGFNPRGLAQAMPAELVGPPAGTLMFADTAFPQPYARPDHLVEYSFAEPYYFVDWNGPGETTQRARPSIHFRHGGLANVAWADGHVSAEPLAVAGEAAGFAVGWFGPPGNQAFDLR